jgi:hypothetical protein
VVRPGLATAMQVARAGTYETRDIIGKHRSRLQLHFKQGLIEKKGQRMGTTMGHLMVSDRIEEKRRILRKRIGPSTMRI